MGFFKKIKKQFRRLEKKVSAEVKRTISKADLEASRLTTKGKERVAKFGRQIDKQFMRGVRDPGNVLTTLSPVRAIDRLQRQIFGGKSSSKKIDKVLGDVALKVVVPLVTGGGIGFFGDVFSAATSGLTGTLTSQSLGQAVGGLVKEVGTKLVGSATQQFIQKNSNISRLFGGPGTTGRAQAIPVALPQPTSFNMAGFGAGALGGLALDTAMRAGTRLTRDMFSGIDQSVKRLAGGGAVAPRATSRGGSTMGLRAFHPHTRHGTSAQHVASTARQLQVRKPTAIGEIILHPDGSTELVHKKKRRRMNPLNPRALNRSFRRIEGFVKAVKRAKKLTKKVKF